MALANNMTSALLHRLLFGTFWTLVGESAARVVPFFVALILARLLGIQAYGLFALVQATIAAFSVFANFGVGQTATRYIAASREDDPARITRIAGLAISVALLAGGVVALAYLAAMPMIMGDHADHAETGWVFYLLSPILLLTSLTGAARGILAGLEAFRSIAALSWMSNLGSAICVCFGAALWGFNGLDRKSTRLNSSHR